jgi:hypothetical protein
MVVYLAMKVGGAVKPWTGADEDSAGKPLRAIISVRRASIRSDVIVAVRAAWSNSDIDADLSLCRLGRCCNQKTTSCCSECKGLKSVHNSPHLLGGGTIPASCADAAVFRVEMRFADSICVNFFVTFQAG